MADPVKKWQRISNIALGALLLAFTVAVLVTPSDLSVVARLVLVAIVVRGAVWKFRA